MNNTITPEVLCYAYRDRYKFLSGDEITKERVGAKAYGLSAIPSAWTLPFFVISSEMFESYFKNRDFVVIENGWRKSITEAAKICKIDLSGVLFLRSNTCAENLMDRGKFESYECNFEQLFTTIKTFFDEMIDKFQYKSGVPLLIQQHSQVIGRGHVSNERRLSQEHRDWKGEIERKNWKGLTTTESDYFTISLRNWRRRVVVNGKDSLPLTCSSLKNVAQILEQPCAWATKHLFRVHFEWIFDGKTVYIVQADEERNYGINPMVQTKNSYCEDITMFSPKVLCLLTAEDEHEYKLYSKIGNPLIYKKLGLQTAPIYLLKDSNELKELIEGRATDKLVSDLTVLAKNSLVIRTDIETENQSLRQMLPRTDDIRDIENALKWLKETSKILFDKYKGEIPFIFILHNFIPAFSSAFAYAEPGTRNVLIESLWGVPEGLYYYAHDKYVMDTKEKDLSKVLKASVEIQQKKINAKNNFIFPDSSGNWNCNQVSPSYIWRQAIPKQDWLREIAINTRKIAEDIGEGVSVMWFVGVNSKIYGCNVFPWHHEKFTVAPQQINRKKNKFESSYTINRNSDIQYIKNAIESGNRENIKYLLFQPVEENMIRNKDLLEEVGTIAKEMGAVIQLEGGVLSHAYYQLKRTGAAVEASNVFDSTILNVDHDKLVRDKIPEKIKNNGEIALTKKISDDELLEQLRIKLVEEALEVLEAVNNDNLVQELADVLEVIDSIVQKQNISMEDVYATKIRKKEKVGGFENGIVLQKTALPLYKSVKDIEEANIKKEDNLASWVDKKEKPDYNEIIKRLKIPISLKEWDTQLTARINKRPDIHVVLKGKRINGSLQLEVSFYEEFEQLSLFDDY